MDSEVKLARKGRAGEPGTALFHSTTPIRERFHRLLPMLLPWRLAFVAGYLALASSVMGQYQSYYYITGNVDQGPKYSFGTSGGTYNSLIPGVDDLIAAVGNLQHATEVQWNLFKYYEDAALSTYVTSAAAAATVGTNMTAMNVNLKAMVNDLEGLRTVMGNGQSNQVNALTLNTAELLALKNGIAPFGTVLSNAVIAGSTTAANILNSGINSNLFAIKGILLTNSFGGSNSIVVNATNGGVQLTNVINVNVPSMANMNDLATRTMNTADANANANTGILNPSPPGAFARSPFAFTNIPPPVTPDYNVVEAGWFKIHLPSAIGGSQDIDLNPMTHFASEINAYHEAMVWALHLLFMFACGKLASDFMLVSGSANQLKIPNIMLFGNSVGAISTPIFIALYVGLSAAFSIAVAGIIDTGSFSILFQNPFRFFSAKVMYVATQFFPLALFVSQCLWLLSSRWTLMGAHWAYTIGLRLMATI